MTICGQSLKPLCTLFTRLDKQWCALHGHDLAEQYFFVSPFSALLVSVSLIAVAVAA